MMKLIAGTRVPLSEEQFADASFVRFYDGHARLFMVPVHRRFAAKVAGMDFPARRVLDIGTGSGRLAIELAKARPDWHVTGIDISENMLKIARQSVYQSGLSDRIDFQQASGEALPFTDGCFDLVVSNASLHLWTDPLKVFKEIARVTSPGGYCFIWDNLRLAVLHPFLSLIGWIMGMDAAQRRLWLQAVRSSYTIGEAKDMLKNSALKDARVIFIPGVFYLGIEWRKP